MRFVTYEEAGRPQVGVLDGDAMVDLAGIAPELPTSLKEVIARGLPADLSRRLGSPSGNARRPLASVKLLVPIPDPGKIVCVGLNYHDHAEETGQKAPDYPPLFMRCTTSLVAAGEPMIVPRASEQLDYEAELTIVIGKRCRNVSEAEALDYVFGYTCFNEGSVRDYQRKSSQWTGAKNFDRTGPVGPWITTADEVPPGADGVRVRTLLNGTVMQDASTSSMIFKVAELVSTISEVMTLEPGDLIPTGTPAGVGMARKPPVWLRPGDTVTIDIEHVGVLTNPVAAEA
jgi:2-keto-4-pentenoate hydratase/2-oxohepta-3-ene-1,7-dioic acid hydratase in catechol pathway